MSWDHLQSTLRRRVQAEKKPAGRLSIIGAMVKYSALGGVVLAGILIPTTTFVAVTASDVGEDIVAMPMELQESENPQTTRLLASNGDLLAYFYEENRQNVPLDEISPVMQDALLSIEDSRFYEHGALDLRGTLRALVNNASDGQTQGGSSITQQLVKLTLVQQATTKEQMRAATETSVARKIRELKLAIDYEEKHTKKDILERYFNIAYFGDGSYGINAAANHFFSVSPAELSVKQAATLAGLVRNPVEFDPIVYPERALQRRNTVLATMARDGSITMEEAEELQAEPLDLKETEFPNGCVSSVAAFSCDYIRRYLLEDEALGETVEARQQQLERGGLTIKSNIDVGMQEAINDAVESNVNATDKAIGSMALVEPGTGKVRGVAQSRPMGTDKEGGESFINFAVPYRYGESLGFQAGSTFKLFTAAAALDKGIPVSKTYSAPPRMTVPTGTYFDCEGRGTDEWEVSNSTVSGTMDMTRGMRQSVNTYFAQLERDAGLCNVVRMAEKMGITVPYDPDNGVTNQVPSFTLGVTSVSPLDMAAAYAVPASGGMYCEPQPVASIEDSAGEVVKEYQAECERVIDEDVAAQLNGILRGLQEPGGFGYSNGLQLNIQSAAKTGTTQRNRSVWYSGYTPEMSAAAMIAGADADGKPIPLAGNSVNGRVVGFSEAAGSSLAGPMWKDAMGVIQSYLTPATFKAPPAPPQRAASGTSNGADDRTSRGSDRGDDEGDADEDD